MMMTEETRKLLNAEKDFERRGHKATLVQNTDRYTVIDWRKADGSGDYYVSYIIDKKRITHYLRRSRGLHCDMVQPE